MQVKVKFVVPGQQYWGEQEVEVLNGVTDEYYEHMKNFRSIVPIGHNLFVVLPLGAHTVQVIKEKTS